MVTMVTAVVGWCLCLAVCHVRGSYIPVEMNKTIQNLLGHYTITNKELFDGKPIFSKEPLSGNLQAEMIYMSAILQTYDKILNQMLKELPTPGPTTAQSSGDKGTAELRSQLNYILKKITNLRIQHYNKPEQLLKMLQPLREVQFNNTVIQSKALWEFIKVYREASSLPNKLEKRRRRRRRQTQMSIRGH
ncbi:interferon gamma 1 [Takifugu flavidus]|uniref:Interferon gamma n=1 Tax=Takifugu flavidus TaxID=433684 RepID=A0A5C6NEG7_9TELE|nr:interferon gamma 1 [Takifugu flavidus]TWW64931.1 hypothetical protein D4764_22G0005780 [Takifugu flavidus]